MAEPKVISDPSDGSSPSDGSFFGNATTQLPTRRHVARMGKAESNLCPSCLATTVTAPHIFACERRVEWRDKFIESFRTRLDKLKTQPDLKNTLLTGLQATLLDRNFLMDPDNREPCFELLVSCQNDTGIRTSRRPGNSIARTATATATATTLLG